MDKTMPEILAVIRTAETWANYLCHAGIGGSRDTNYYREDKVLEQQAEIDELVRVLKKRVYADQSDWNLIDAIDNEADALIAKHKEKEL